MRIDLEGFHGSRDDVHNWTIREMRDQAERIVLSRSNPTYNDLQGVFWDEYVRWSTVSHKHLYDIDKTSFKIEFEKYIDNLRTKADRIRKAVT